MATVKATVMVRNTVQIIKHRVRPILQSDAVGSHVKAFNRELDSLIDFLLIDNLSVGQIEEPTLARIL